MTAEPPSDLPMQQDGLGPRWRSIDRSLPWVMGVWALLAMFALPLDETFHVDAGRPLAGLLAAHATVWTVLAVTASGLALRHARAAQPLLPRLAWCVVPAVLALALPIVAVLLSEHPYTEDDKTCSAGILPAEAAQAAFGWIPWGAYAVVPLVAGLIGLGFLLLGVTTRRAGAWILVSTMTGFALALSTGLLIVNHCD